MKWPFRVGRRDAARQEPDSLLGLEVAAPFCPTPWSVARKMLELAEAGPDDVVYDLGSGDGRIPILAAQEFGCRAVGIERDPQLFLRSSEKTIELYLQDRVRFLNADFFTADFSSATVVTLYLLSAVNGHLQQRLASHLRAGARVVALDYEVPGWRMDRSSSAKSEGNVDYTVHLYRRETSGSLWTAVRTGGAASPEVIPPSLTATGAYS